MVSSEEKRKCIENIIELSATEETKSIALKNLYQVLLKDTLNGKLYKYRSFDDKGYALANLNDGTLHCSKPSEFNDPFDCKIGITFNSIFKAKYESEFDVIMEVYNKFLSVIRNEANINNCSDDVRRLIIKLQNNNIIMNFIKANDGKNLSEQEMGEILKDNANVVLELLQVFLEDDYFKDTLGVCSKMMPQLVERISPAGMLMLSDENATYEDFAKANGVFEDADEIELTMLMSEKISPELADARADIMNLIDDKDNQINTKLVDLFVVGCLCADYKNRLMWSHYADSHKGFCIEYDYNNLTEDEMALLPLPIVYSKERPLLPWKAALENTPENISEATAQIILGLLTKDDEWRYENEWRILVSSKGPTEFKMPKISCIYLGVAISDENKAKILEIAKRKNILVKQMKIDRGTYALHAATIIN